MVISFSTGSAMGTMGILFPLLLPLAYRVACAADGGGGGGGGGGSGGGVSSSSCATEVDPAVLVSCAASIFAGCSFGNSCSPIGDTTILTALALQCNLDSHVRTMLPHCLLVGAISVVVSFLPIHAGVWVWWAVALALIVLFLAIVGRNPEREAIGRSGQSKRCRCAATSPCWRWQRQCCSPKKRRRSSGVEETLLDDKAT